MKKKLFLFLCFLFLLGCSNNKPKDSVQKIEELTGKEYLEKYGETLSLTEAIEIAKERNLDLKVKSLEREISTLDRNIAFGNFLPSINVMGNYTRLNQGVDINMDTSSLAAGVNNLLKGLPLPPTITDKINMPTSVSSRVIDKSFYTYGITAQIPVFVPSTWYLYAARKKGEEISGLIENLAEKMIELQTMGEYFYILALEAENKTLTNEVKSADELYKKAKISLDVEAILPWECEKALAFKKSKEFALNENERELLIAKMNFMKDLNLNPLDNVKLEDEKFGNKEVGTLEDCIYDAVANNEMLKISELGKGVSKDIKKIAITNFLPKIILGGGYVKNSNDILADPSFLHGNVSGILSIFNGFKNINEYKKSVRREKIANLKLEKEFMTTIVETAKAYKNYEKAKELNDIATLNLKASKGELHQKLVEKKVEMIGEEEYYTALANYDRALSMQKEAEFNYQMALGSLKIAMGKSPFKEENKK